MVAVSIIAGRQFKMMHLIFGFFLIFSFSLDTSSQTPTQPSRSNNKNTGCNNECGKFISEVSAVWRAKAKCNVVPAERTQELLQELSFHPNDKQTKTLASKGSRQSNGLTFGEFCVLAADLKRFRTSSFASKSLGHCENTDLLDSPCTHDKIGKKQEKPKSKATNTKTKSPSVEVFLGGSCNPTTWRADVAIPGLKKQGISFYNPQVSDWTPDLIELEHRAKEEARVLFFVMDSETRAAASGIESAYIAGQNCKQLVLVLRPYKPNQSISNERITQQEYIDLISNQQLLRELVTSRGLHVLNDIPEALQRTKKMLDDLKKSPSTITSTLVLTRAAFDRVKPISDLITAEQCRKALLYLGYAENLVKMDSLKKIIADQRSTLAAMNMDKKQCSGQQKPKQQQNPKHKNSSQQDNIDFNLFCVISSYLSVLQSENSLAASSEGRSRDSGTSLPQPLKPLRSPSQSSAPKAKSDSSDSAFSSSSSLNSINCCGPATLRKQMPDFREVYLGGSSDLHSKWRQQIAIPYLKSKGISYHMPPSHESMKPTQANLPMPTNLYNPKLLESSRVLLFVISNDSRSLAQMTLAAHCIGLMYNVVLSVQMLPNELVIGNEKLTATAIKDYNRGRSYLIDLAKREGVPVFDDIKAALAYTAGKIQSYNCRLMDTLSLQ